MGRNIFGVSVSSRSMYELPSNIEPGESTEDALSLIQNDYLRKWLHTHSSVHSKDSVSSKYEHRYQDSRLLRHLKDGLKYDEDRKKELEATLIFSEVDYETSMDMVRCGDSLSDCQRTIEKLAHKHENNLRNLRHKLHSYDKELRCIGAGMSPATILTEYRRKLIFQALLHSEEVPVKRERAAQILDMHIASADVLIGKPGDEKDSLDRLVQTSSDGDHMSELSGDGLSESSSFVRPPKQTSKKKNQSAFRSDQAFHPQWGNYDAMRARWRSQRPTPARLKPPVE